MCTHRHVPSVRLELLQVRRSTAALHISCASSRDQWRGLVDHEAPETSSRRQLRHSTLQTTAGLVSSRESSWEPLLVAKCKATASTGGHVAALWRSALTPRKAGAPFLSPLRFADFDIIRQI